jgi:hypothetical protein
VRHHQLFGQHLYFPESFLQILPVEMLILGYLFLKSFASPLLYLQFNGPIGNPIPVLLSPPTLITARKLDSVIERDRWNLQRFVELTQQFSRIANLW